MGNEWSGEWGSNPRPSRWQREALPLSYLRILHNIAYLEAKVNTYLEEPPRFELGPQGFAVPRISRFAMAPIMVSETYLSRFEYTDANLQCRHQK